jgi:hypothetical protein
LVTEYKKSSFCDAGACVEVGQINDVVLVRSTTAPEKVVTFTADEWTRFIQGAQAGEFNLDPS